jgi:hypothetical protein
MIQINSAWLPQLARPVERVHLNRNPVWIGTVIIVEGSEITEDELSRAKAIVIGNQHNSLVLEAISGAQDFQ